MASVRAFTKGLLPFGRITTSPVPSAAHTSVLAPLPQDKQSTERIEAIAANAQAKVTEGRSAVRDKDWFKRSITVPTAPIFIASTEDIGTDRVRANHVDAAINYCVEQEALRKAGAPIS